MDLLHEGHDLYSSRQYAKGVADAFRREFGCHGSTSTECDMASGPCACGAWHSDGDDTTGMPIGWTIVAIGDDGSVLCRAPSGRRARFWFGEKPAQ